MRYFKNLVMSLLISTALLGCGGGGSSSSASPSSSTRTVSGSFATPSPMLIQTKQGLLPLPQFSKSAGLCAAASGQSVCRVVAMATDGTTVTDENLGSCTFSLALTTGKNYIISFIGTNPATSACDVFLANLSIQASSLLNIQSGDAVDLGTISMSGQNATCSGSFSDITTCAALGLNDADGDGFCDGWDGEAPASDDFSATGCQSSSDCTGGAICTACDGASGYCLSSDYVCTSAHSCAVGERCILALCSSPGIGYCDYADSGETECTTDSDCSWLGSGATCSSGFCQAASGGCTVNSNCADSEVCTSGACVTLNLNGDYISDLNTGTGCDLQADYALFPQTERVSGQSGLTISIVGLVAPAGAECSHDSASVALTRGDADVHATGVALNCPEDSLAGNSNSTRNTITFNTSSTPTTVTRTVTQVIGDVDFWDPDCALTYTKQ